MRFSTVAGKLIETPEVDALLVEVAAVCKRHGLSIGHEDTHGSFTVTDYDDEYEAWLLAASDDRALVRKENGRCTARYCGVRLNSTNDDLKRGLCWQCAKKEARAAAWNPRIIHHEDGAAPTLILDIGECWSRFGCYDTDDDAARAGDFLFGPNGWAARWSDHGWWYVQPVVMA